MFKKNSLDYHKRKIDKEMNVKVKDANKILKEKRKMNDITSTEVYKKAFLNYMANAKIKGLGENQAKLLRRTQ